MTAGSDRGERADRRGRCAAGDGGGARCRVDCRRVRWAGLRSVADHRRQRRQPHRCDRDSADPSAARFWRTASPCNPAAARRSASSAKRRWWRCRARWTRPLRRWWTALPVLDRLSGRRPRRTLNLPLARYEFASAVGIAEIVVLERKPQGVWMPLAAGDLARCDRAGEAWLAVPGAPKDLLRVRRSCLYVAGMMGSRMTNTPRPGKSPSISIRTVPHHPVARGRPGAVRGRAVSRALCRANSEHGRGAGICAGAGYLCADRRAAVRSFQCRWFCGALRRSRLSRRSRTGAGDAERRSDRLRHAADAAGLVGNGDAIATGGPVRAAPVPS